MLSIENKVRQVPVGDRGAVPDGVLTATEPLLLKGLVAHWPVVAAGLQSAPAAVDYLRGFYRDATVGAWMGSPDIGGRFFYNDDMTGFNYKPVMTKLDLVLEKLLEHLGDAYLKLNDRNNALKFYKKSLAIKEKDTEELENKIKTLAENGS